MSDAEGVAALASNSSSAPLHSSAGTEPAPPLHQDGSRGGSDAVGTESRLMDLMVVVAVSASDPFWARTASAGEPSADDVTGWLYRPVAASLSRSGSRPVQRRSSSAGVGSARSGLQSRSVRDWVTAARVAWSVGSSDSARDHAVRASGSLGDRPFVACLAEAFHRRIVSPMMTQHGIRATLRVVSLPGGVRGGPSGGPGSLASLAGLTAVGLGADFVMGVSDEASLPWGESHPMGWAWSIAAELASRALPLVGVAGPTTITAESANRVGPRGVLVHAACHRSHFDRYPLHQGGSDSSSGVVDLDGSGSGPSGATGGDLSGHQGISGGRKNRKDRREQFGGDAVHALLSPVPATTVQSGAPLFPPRIADMCGGHGSRWLATTYGGVGGPLVRELSGVLVVVPERTGSGGLWEAGCRSYGSAGSTVAAEESLISLWRLERWLMGLSLATDPGMTGVGGLGRAQPEEASDPAIGPTGMALLEDLHHVWLVDRLGLARAGSCDSSSSGNACDALASERASAQLPTGWDVGPALAAVRQAARAVRVQLRQS